MGCRGATHVCVCLGGGGICSVRFIKHYKALTAETEGQTSAKSAGEYVVGQQRMAKEGGPFGKFFQEKL